MLYAQQTMKLCDLAVLEWSLMSVLIAESIILENLLTKLVENNG